MSLYLTKSLNGLSNSDTDPTGKDTSRLLVNGMPRGILVDNIIKGTDPLYEWLCEKANACTKPYFDVDYTCQDADEYEVKQTEVLNNALDVLYATFPDITPEHLRISSYNGVEKSPKATKKYGKYLVSYHIVVKDYRTTIAQNKTMAQVLNGKYEHYDVKPYSANQLFRVAGHHKHSTRDAGCRDPRHLYFHDGKWQTIQSAQKTVNGQDILDFKYDHLINLTQPDDPPLVLKDDDESATLYDTADTNDDDDDEVLPVATVALDEVLALLLSFLSMTECNDRNKWWYITKCIKSYSASAEAKATWDEWSQKSKNYDKAGNDKIWNGMKDLFDNGMARLKKKCDIVHKIHYALMNYTEEKMCDLFEELYKNFFKVIHYPKVIYMFDEHDTLWKLVNKDYFNTFLTRHFAPLRETYRHLLNKDPCIFLGEVQYPDDTAETKKKVDEERKKCINMLLFNLKKSEMTDHKNKYQKEFFTRTVLHDQSFTELLNSNPDVLSCRNGVLNLKTKEFRKRRYDDYLSKCLQLEYNPDAPVNPHWHKFINDMFDATELNAKEVVRYMQCALGYGITGKNTEQRCFILFGKGSNGKSLLNDVITTVLRCAFGKMTEPFNSNLFDDVSSKKESANQASPERAKLVDCCIGLVNESAQGLLFGEMFKKLVDNTQSLSYRQLNMPSAQLRLITKFFMATNYFPLFPVEKAFIRRIETVPCLMTFTENPTKPNDRPIDKQLFDKMCGTTEGMQGILNWFIEGASMYYANDSHIYELPACCQVYKDNYVSKNDWTNLFAKTENKNDVMTYDEIYATINAEMQRRDLTKAKITDTLQEMGFVRKRKMIQQRKLYVFTHIVPAHTNDEEEEGTVYGFSGV